MKRSATVKVKFIQPGDRANPIPLGTTFAFGDGWLLKVVSATIDATAQIVAITDNTPPPPGAQYTMLNVAATYTGAGHSTFDGGRELKVVGAHNFAYGSCYQELPPPTFPLYRDVYSGQSIGGNICFEIASNDADSLLLSAYFWKDDRDETVWFALR